ncbi:MAG: hypothetical protein JOZ25_09125 [Actinobacteria bacterium]|nr:hypothetical protein [Actinomycetota bacterium]
MRVRAGAVTLRPRVGVRPADGFRAGSRAARLRPSLSPRARRWVVIAMVAAAALAALYVLWFRDSSLVRVERVSVTGLAGADAGHLRARLEYAARQMTTLHVDEAALMRALGPGAGVRSLSVETSFPHAMRIVVVQELPVAVLVTAGDRAPVGGDGELLPSMPATGVPAVAVATLPMHGRLGGGRTLLLVRCAAAAPRSLLSRIDHLGLLPDKGLVAYVRNGPQIIFGDVTALTAKWEAAAAVLADSSSRGASYIDVRIPGRPVAGGLRLALTSQDQMTAPGAGQLSTGPVQPTLGAGPAGASPSGLSAGAAGASGAVGTTGTAGTTGAGSVRRPGFGAGSGVAGPGRSNLNPRP